MVVAQLVERSVQTPEVRIQSSANFYIEHLFTVNYIEKANIKKKRRGIAHLIKNSA